MIFHWWKAIAQEKKGWQLSKPQIASSTCSPNALSAFTGSSAVISSELQELLRATEQCNRSKGNHSQASLPQTQASL